jgi:hypothetical protein
MEGIRQADMISAVEKFAVECRSAHTCENGCTLTAQEDVTHGSGQVKMAEPLQEL